MDVVLPVRATRFVTMLRGYVAGEAIVALCGKTFVPSRDYEGLPVCDACQGERDRILSGMKRLN